MAMRSIDTCSIAVLLLAALAAMPPAHAADSACKPPYAALEKVAMTPNHQFATLAEGKGQAPTRNETIFDGSRMYLLTEGKWTALPYDGVQTVKDMRDAEGQAHCTNVRDESVGGEAAAVYSVHRSGMDMQVWISKSRGLPLRQTIDTDGMHTDARFEYANVKAPAGAQ